MNEDVRLAKNERIRIKGKATRERHEKMRAVTVSLKLSLGCLNNKERSKLLSYFIQCRWLCNYLLGLSNEEFSLFDTKERDITSLDKDGNKVERHLDIPAKLIQDVKANLIGDMTALNKKRSKTGKANGKLKFRSEYNSISLSQYNNTHWIVAQKDGNKNGKYKNTVHIAGIKRPIRAFGMEQIPPSAEFSSAKLIKRPSGVYLALTCFVPNNTTSNSIENINASNAIGIDFGIKTTITTSSGEKFDISIRESERLIGLQRKLSRQKKGSKSRYNTRLLIQREYEKLSNKRRDKANKIYHTLTSLQTYIVMQDENIKGWQKGLFGKEVQNSALGTLKDKLKRNPNVIVIDRFFPSTKLCPICGTVKDDITLKDRTYVCQKCGYREDRDVKSAKTILLAGLGKITCTCVERTSTPVERASDSVVKRRQSRLEKLSNDRKKLEASPLANARMR